MAESMRLNPVKFGIAMGLVWALGMLLMGWASWLCGYGDQFVSLLGSVYTGYDSSFIGGIIGAIWGFIDLFIFGFLVAWIYNCCGRCCPKHKAKADVS